MTKTTPKANEKPARKGLATRKVDEHKAAKGRAAAVPAATRIELRAKKEVKELIERAA